MPELADGILFYVVFLFSITLHEAAHAWAAKLGGDLTAYHGGQVSLDPMPHIRREPFGMVILPLLSAVTTGWPFGFASAPYDPEWARKHPKRAALMALAGPGANLLLVLIAAALLRIGALAGVFYAPGSVSFGHLAGSDAGGLWPTLGTVLSAFFSLNLVLGAFNLLPCRRSTAAARCRCSCRAPRPDATRSSCGRRRWSASSASSSPGRRSTSCSTRSSRGR